MCSHSIRLGWKAEDYERLMRSQASAIEAEAQVRARETLDRARTKSQKIVDSVTTHTSTVLRDAEDHARQLRWQQQQLASFMAEVREMIRPEGVFSDESPASAPKADAAVAVAGATEVAAAAASDDVEIGDVDDEVETFEAEIIEAEPADVFLVDEVLEDELLDDEAATIDGKITIDVVDAEESTTR